MRMAPRAPARAQAPRELPEETPVALCFNGSTYAVMMATPADLEDFARGFALTEGLTDDPTALDPPEIVRHGQGLEVRLWLPAASAARLAARRRAMAGPVGCGLCGIDSLAEALSPAPRVPQPARPFPHADVLDATERLRRRQPLHDRTRAVHAAGFWRPGAGLLVVREDVGRHNAADKLVGAMAGQGGCAAGALVLTSRISVELVQKAAAAGIAAMIAVSAPTELAVRTAAAAGVTLFTNARDGGFDVYPVA